MGFSACSVNLQICNKAFIPAIRPLRAKERRFVLFVCDRSVSLRSSLSLSLPLSAQHLFSSMLFLISHAHTLRFAIQRTSPWTMQSNRGNIIFFFLFFFFFFFCSHFPTYVLNYLICRWLCHLSTTVTVSSIEPRRLKIYFL